MKKKDLKKHIEDAIVEILSGEVNERTAITKQTNPGEAKGISKSERVPEEDVRNAIQAAKQSGETQYVAETPTKPSSEDIKRKYSEMFGKNPQTTFADVAKFYGMDETEIGMILLGLEIP
jgi:hypothetical protein